MIETRLRVISQIGTRGATQVVVTTMWRSLGERHGGVPVLMYASISMMEQRSHYQAWKTGKLVNR